MKKTEIKKLLSRMTTDEKIGQLVQYNANFFEQNDAEITGPLQKLGAPEDQLKYVGSTLNYSTVDDMIRIQTKHMEQDPNRIPMVFMMDIIHGFRTIYPIPLALGASFSESLVADCAAMAAREASSGGVQVTFAPMMDAVRDPRWGRVLESFGESAVLNSKMGAVQVRAMQGDKLSADPETVAVCVKHFAAYGAPEGGRDYNTVEISERLLREYYLPGYKACLDAGAQMIMPSFNSLNGVPSVANSFLMKQILKKEWKFKGIVISDYAAIQELMVHGVAKDLLQAGKMAFANGCTIEMMSAAYQSHLKKMIEDGIFSEADLDREVLKVLNFKNDLGLFDDPMRGASAKKEKATCLTAENRMLARRAARECAVLLKNDGVLPFSASVRKIALIGPFADSKAIRGAWAHTGSDGDCVSVKEGIQNLLPDAEVVVVPACTYELNAAPCTDFADAVRAAKEADAVVLCLGEGYKQSGEGACRAEITLTANQTELARSVLAVNDNAAVLLFNGRPLVLTELDKIAPAILDMWFPGTEGGNAAAELLFGVYAPAGKVPMSFPRSIGQIPVYHEMPITGRPKTNDDKPQGYRSGYLDCPNRPLYPFGWGLTYTEFEYLSMDFDRTALNENEMLTVTVRLQNKGSRSGKETVQLYLRDCVASVVRPRQSFIAHKQVELAPGEVGAVTFEVSEPMLRFVNADCRTVSEPGKFELSVGCADHLKLTKSFTLE